MLGYNHFEKNLPTTIARYADFVAVVLYHTVLSHTHR